MPTDRRTDPDDVFPGIFAGATAGDFAGLPPTPEQATARVPELAIRLSRIAEAIGLAIQLDNRWHEAEIESAPASRAMHEARARLHGARRDLHALAGLPPTPEQATGRVLELAARLRKLAGELGEALRCFNRKEAVYWVSGVRGNLNALADELAAEGGDQ